MDPCCFFFPFSGAALIRADPLKNIVCFYFWSRELSDLSEDLCGGPHGVDKRHQQAASNHPAQVGNTRKVDLQIHPWH